MQIRSAVLCIATLALGESIASAQSLSCPAVSSNTTNAGATLQTECAGSVTQGCTEKSGVSYDASGNVLKLPGSAGNFQSPPSAAVPQNVYFAAPGDFDKDGWTDFVAANDSDKIYVMRNQTITCGTTGCSGNATTAPTAQTIAASWWNTLGNKRSAAFRYTTTSGGADLPLKAAVSGTQRMSPIGAGDFDGDGWTDFVQISATYQASPGTLNVVSWPTAARLFLNTQNCRLKAAVAPNITPCGIGNICTGQATNGACTGPNVQNGVAWLDTQLSCTNTNTCHRYMPTFATYDLLTGAAVTTAVGTASTPTTGSATKKPGDFGPIGHPVQNIVVLDFDGDGDLDFLYGHSGGTCPGSLCSGGATVFYAGIDVWRNSCAQSPQWNAATKSCIGHIPVFTKGTTGTCNGTSCNNPDVLIPSTAHNSTTLAPNAHLGFDVSSPNGDKRAPGFAYVDIDKDNDYDLVIGSPGCCSSAYQNRLRIFRGTSNSKFVHTLDTANPIILSTSSGTAAYKGFEGSLTAVFVSDFSGDGWPDIITGSDGYGYDGTLGGRTRYWKHTGNTTNPYGTNWPSCSATPATCAGCSASCKPEPTTYISQSCGSATCSTNLAASPPQFPDFDMGLMLDYDRDPSATLDMVFTNGNTSGEFYIFPNRASSATYAACGTAVSGELPVTASELTVSGACIAPSATVPAGTSISYYLSNEDPANYQLACKQTGNTTFAPALVGGKCCVTFSRITGRTVTWKAVFDSNSADDPACGLTGTTTPSLTSVVANYTYTEAAQHFRSGVVVYDGVTYTGSFAEPGDRGHLYALAAGDGSRYYDAATKLDAQGTRYVYTTDNVGTTLNRINFSPTSPSAALTARVGATTSAQATNVINWVLSARFGVTAPLSKLGAVISSTPAVLGSPYRPSWYSYLTASEKALYDNFATTNVNRLPLVLFAALDGMLHAVISKATSIGDSQNGQEAWAFIPPYVAASMTNDYTTTQADPEGDLHITSFSDGSPTLFDYKKSDGTVHTVALVPDGTGGSSVTALDVTNTIDTSYNRTGPTPMWSQIPGGSDAGKAITKPALARVKIAGVETYLAVAGTGIHSTDTTKGSIVAGFNLETGALLWKFQAACAVTSDIAVFETDDLGEPGVPELDGYIDRVVFADKCGYVYKLDPAQNLSGGYMSNTGFGTISLGTSNGAARFALFSTTQTGALGGTEQRPIAGTIGARADNTTDMVLFFGTGGLEAYDTAKTNEFYAVYAKNGSIRSKVTGTCTSGPTRCEKFYGGVVVTSDTVIMQRSTDAKVGSSDCDFGSSRVQALNLSSFNSVFDISSVDGQPLHASTGPLYGDAGALYFATVSGEVKRIGQPRATTAGADSTAGTLHQMSPGGSAGTAPFSLLGWRVVL